MVIVDTDLGGLEGLLIPLPKRLDSRVPVHRKIVTDAYSFTQSTNQKVELLGTCIECLSCVY